MRVGACLITLSFVLSACDHGADSGQSVDGGVDVSAFGDAAEAVGRDGADTTDVRQTSFADASVDQYGEVDAKSGQWTAVSRMPTARGYLAAVLGPDSRIYALGGLAPGQAALRVVEAYDPARDSWTTVAPMRVARYGLTAAVGSDGRIYAIGGNYEGKEDGNSALVEAYDPVTDTWTAAPNLTVGRFEAAAVTGPDGAISVMGGFSRSLGEEVPTIEVYSPGAGSWASRPGLMTTPRSAHVAVLAKDGTIFAIGGIHNGTKLSATEARGPGENRWFTRADMPTARMGAAAAQGADGTIYVIGGSAGAGSLSTVEAYSPTTNTWRTTPDMPTGRNFLAAATGPDGRIYVIGGITGVIATAVGTVEVYRP